MAIVHKKATMRDARDPLFLYVDLQDVKSADRKDPEGCAATKAILRQCGAQRALVHLTSVYIKYPKEWVRYRTPTDLRKQIISFDRHGKFEGGIYRLQTPEPANALGSRRRDRKRPGKHRAKAMSTRTFKARKRAMVVGVRRAAPRGKSLEALLA